jgi:hypothetical protein
MSCISWNIIGEKIQEAERQISGQDRTSVIGEREQPRCSADVGGKKNAQRVRQ